MDFSKVNFNSLVPGFIPAEHSMLFLVVFGVCAFFFIFFGVPRLLKMFLISIARLVARFFSFTLSLILNPLCEKFPKFKKFLSTISKYYYKSRGIAYFEINTIEDGMNYLRYQEEHRKLNGLPVSWLYDRVNGELLTEAAEALRKLSVIPDRNGVYKLEINVNADGAANGNYQQQNPNSGRDRRTNKKKNQRYDFRSSYTRGKKTAKKKKARPTNPYWKVLDIPAGSSKEEIKKAYRRKMKEYHPDMVAHLGPEIQKVALEKTRAVQMAYESLTK